MAKKRVDVSDLTDSQKFALVTLGEREVFKIYMGGNTSYKLVNTAHQIAGKRGIELEPDIPLAWKSLTYKFGADLKELRTLGLVKESSYKKRDPTKPTGYEVQDIYLLTKDGERLAETIRSEEAILDTKQRGLVTRTASFFFLITGFIFMILPGLSTTGNVVGSSTGGNFSFLASLALRIIGEILLFRSFKK